MAPKDYVTRTQKSKAQNRPKSTRGRQTHHKQAQASTPWLRILFAIVIIAAFVYGLTVLQQSGVETNNGQKEQTQTNNKPNVGADVLELENSNATANDLVQTVKPLAPLPVLGEEEWEFIDSLPEFSVEVDATGPVKSDREYIMQCGSFKTQGRAEELKARLALQGFEARVIVSNGGKWYRVVLGPYESKREAESDRHILRRAKIQGCKIW